MSEGHIQKPTWYLLTMVSVISGLIGGIVSIFLAPFIGSTFTHSEHTPTEQRILDTEENAVVRLIERANPAVVSIVIEKDVQKILPSRGIFFDEFFGFLPPDFIDPRNPSNSPNTGDNTTPQLRQIGGGSGFIVSSDGLIVTNKHVISDSDAVYSVVLSNGKEFSAKVVATDPLMDVGFIKIDAQNLPTLELGNSDDLRIGQTVLAIGYALAEFGNTVTKGVISGIGRHVEAGNGRGSIEVLEEAIQTDAAINPGNSGGPLLDLSGKVVGINTAVSEAGQLLGFAIPINNLRKIIESVEKEGRIVRPWLGVRYIVVTPRLVELNTLPVTYGVLIRAGDSKEEPAVIPGSPAAKAGIVENDILLEVNGEKLEDKDSLAKIISKYSIGDTVTIKLFHEGKEKEVKVTLEEMPVLADIK